MRALPQRLPARFLEGDGFLQPETMNQVAALLYGRFVSATDDAQPDAGQRAANQRNRFDQVGVAAGRRNRTGGRNGRFHGLGARQR